MNLSKIRRISKLELLAGMGNQACKLIIYQILDSVKTLYCEQVLHDPKHKQRKDIAIIIEGVDLSKFPKPI